MSGLHSLGDISTGDFIREREHQLVGSIIDPPFAPWDACHGFILPVLEGTDPLDESLGVLRGGGTLSHDWSNLIAEQKNGTHGRLISTPSPRSVDQGFELSLRRLVDAGSAVRDDLSSDRVLVVLLPADGVSEGGTLLLLPVLVKSHDKLVDLVSRTISGGVAPHELP